MCLPACFSPSPAVFVYFNVSPPGGLSSFGFRIRGKADCSNNYAGSSGPSVGFQSWDLDLHLVKQWLSADRKVQESDGCLVHEVGCLSRSLVYPGGPKKAGCMPRSGVGRRDSQSEQAKSKSFLSCGLCIGCHEKAWPSVRMALPIPAAWGFS